MIITICRKPFLGSVIENIKKNQCGGFNVLKIRTGGKHQSRFPSNFFVSLSTSKLFPHTETHAGTYRNKSHCIGTSFTVTRPKGAVTSEGNSGSASRYFKMVEE